MQNLQWYPGHMAKTRRMIEENLKNIDVVVEILDARIPFSGRNPNFDDIIKGKPRLIVMNKSDLEKIADIIRDTNIIVLSDEIYGELTYSGKHVSIASLPGMYERTVVINGFSKAFAMTGWRLGFAVGPEEIIRAMTKVHQYAIMSAPTMSQFAAIEALNNGDDDIERMREEYNIRRRMIVDSFNSIGLDCFEPEGAFYVFPSIQKTGLSSEDFCESLLKEKKVAVVPGNAFGDSGEGFIRASYCYSTENIKKALSLIDEFVNK